MASFWQQPRSRRTLLVAAGSAVLAACTSRARRAAAPASSGPATPAAVPSRTVTTALQPSPSASSGAARVVRHADTGRPEVALTFHGSGDPALAVRLLAAAEHDGATVTILAVGTWLQANPEMAARILKGGHALGNHTYTHPTLHRLSPSAIRSEVSRCAALLQRLTGSPGAAFRPSGGPTITPPMVAAATASGYDLVLGYDVDPSDNLDPGASAVASRVLAGARPGSIVSLHLGHAGTVEALPHILSGLRSRGLHAVTAPRLLAPS
ncbi:MAG: polysaccharide deacetylase [Frankiales bacterium]|nr:polysaccharide deacetylase [Frankiales bacterium]